MTRPRRKGVRWLRRPPMASGQMLSGLCATAVNFGPPPMPSSRRKRPTTACAGMLHSWRRVYQRTGQEDSRRTHHSPPSDSSRMPAQSECAAVSRLNTSAMREGKVVFRHEFDECQHLQCLVGHFANGGQASSVRLPAALSRRHCQHWPLTATPHSPVSRSLPQSGGVFFGLISFSRTERRKKKDDNHREKSTDS